MGGKRGSGLQPLESAQNTESSLTPAGNAFFADSAAKQPPPGTKGPARPRTGLQPRVFHPLCAGRARRAAVCEHTHAARGKCAENGTKGTCLGQKAGRGGRFLGSGAPGGSGQRSRAASRWQRRGTRSSGRAATGSVDFASFTLHTLSQIPSFLQSGFPPIHNTTPRAASFLKSGCPCKTQPPHLLCARCPWQRSPEASRLRRPSPRPLHLCGQALRRGPR